MGPLTIIKTGFEIISGIGIDSILTGVAKQVVPQTCGAPGVIQKICTKAGTISLSFLASDAIGSLIEKYADEIADSFKEEIENKA